MKQIKLQTNVAPAPRDLQNKIAACKVAKGGDQSDATETVELGGAHDRQGDLV